MLLTLGVGFAPIGSIGLASGFDRKFSHAVLKHFCGQNSPLLPHSVLPLPLELTMIFEIKKS